MDNSSSTHAEHDLDAHLVRRIAHALAPQHPPRGHADLLARRLHARAQASAAAHSDLLTCRGRDGTWRAVRPGIRMKELWRGDAGNSVLIELMPGAVLPVHRHGQLEEGIVLRGGMQLGTLELGPFDYHVSLPGSRHERITSRQGTLTYLRGTALGDGVAVVRELLGGLLPHRGPAPETVFHADPVGWVEVAPGAWRRCLHSEGDMESSYIRLEPGATLPAHGHARDEETIVLEGEVFLGDLLLLAGDYQVARTGTQHGAAATDVGALLFVRGDRQAVSATHQPPVIPTMR